MVVRIDELCNEIDPHGALPAEGKASAATATEAPTPTGASATDAPADDGGAAPVSAEGDAVVSEPAGMASEESAEETEVEFARRLREACTYDFGGTHVAPLIVQLLLAGGAALFDAPVPIVPADRHELVGELRALAIRWARRYAGAIEAGCMEC